MKTINLQLTLLRGAWCALAGVSAIATTGFCSSVSAASNPTTPAVTLVSTRSHSKHGHGVMAPRGARISQREAGRIAKRYLGARRIVRFEGVRNGAYIVHLDKGGRRYHVLVGTRTGRVVQMYRLRRGQY